MRDTRMPESSCLHCGRKMDGATDAFGAAVPKQGDFSVCIYCGHLMVFTKSLRLRNPNDREIVDIAGDEKLLIVQRLIRAYNADKAKDRRS